MVNTKETFIFRMKAATCSCFEIKCSKEINDPLEYERILSENTHSHKLKKTENLRYGD